MSAIDDAVKALEGAAKGPGQWFMVCRDFDTSEPTGLIALDGQYGPGQLRKIADALDAMIAAQKKGGTS